MEQMRAALSLVPHTPDYSHRPAVPDETTYELCARFSPDRDSGQSLFSIDVFILNQGQLSSARASIEDPDDAIPHAIPRCRNGYIGLTCS